MHDDSKHAALSRFYENSIADDNKNTALDPSLSSTKDEVGGLRALLHRQTSITEKTEVKPSPFAKTIVAINFKTPSLEIASEWFETINHLITLAVKQEQEELDLINDVSSNPTTSGGANDGNAISKA